MLDLRHYGNLLTKCHYRRFNYLKLGTMYSSLDTNKAFDLSLGMLSLTIINL